MNSYNSNTKVTSVKHHAKVQHGWFSRNSIFSGGQSLSKVENSTSFVLCFLSLVSVGNWRQILKAFNISRVFQAKMQQKAFAKASFPVSLQGKATPSPENISSNAAVSKRVAIWIYKYIWRERQGEKGIQDLRARLYNSLQFFSWDYKCGFLSWNFKYKLGRYHKSSVLMLSLKTPSLFIHSPELVSSLSCGGMHPIICSAIQSSILGREQSTALVLRCEYLKVYRRTLNNPLALLFYHCRQYYPNW